MERFIALITFVGFTGLVGLITWWRTRRADHETSTGYFLAGRSLGPAVIAGSLLLTNLSTEQLVGLNGAAYADGFVVMAWEVIAAASLVAMGLLFLPYYLRSGIATVPQFLEERFDHNTRAITTIIFIVAYAVILLPIILFTGATGLNSMLGIQTLAGFGAGEAGRVPAIWMLVWLVGLIGSTYAIFGGLKSVAISDTLNGLGLLVGGVMITWLGLSAVGDGNVVEGLTTLTERYPEKFDSVGTWEQSVPFSTIFSGVLLLNLFYWCTNQQIIQRTFGAQDLARGQKGVLLAGWLKVFTPIILILPGIIAFSLATGGELSMDSQDQAYGKLVDHVLPSWLTGFFAAVVIGAVLSSFNSALNSCATLFSYGVYRSMARPDASDAEVIRSGKWFAGVVAIVAMIVAPFLLQAGGIFEYLQKMNGLYFIPIFAVVVGIFARRVPPIAANVALILGCGVIAVGYFAPGVDQYVTAMNGFHFLGAVFAGLVVLMLGIGAARPLPEPWRQTYSGDVDMTPWPAAKWVGLALVAFVIATYVFLAGGL